MKKALFLASLLGIMFSVVPVANAQSCCGGYYSNPYQQQVGSPTDAFSDYQYPIPWYTYFETPNATAHNYYPSNYTIGQGQYSYYPTQNSYGNQYPQSSYYPQSAGNYGYPQSSYGYGQGQGYSSSPYANSSSPASFNNPSGFQLTGMKNTFAYVSQ